MFYDRIIGDLWLYNNAIAPENINWEQQDLPFLNPNYFLKAGINIAPIVNRRELLCQWTMDSNGKELLKVDIIIKKVLTGRLKPGDMPGYSTLVKMDGPLAKVLTEVSY
ncbi:hypothetical protein SAMN05428947_111147 [Mucilaginibacter sp. OK283]|nr:hypothetical protein SAMN05428947_111147 [Mucilaginibacter sp. OK283]